MELKVLQERLGFTAIYVTHDQTEAFALAETIHRDEPRPYRNRGPAARGVPPPAHPFVARFLGLNVMAGRDVAWRPRTSAEAGTGAALRAGDTCRRVSRCGAR